MEQILMIFPCPAFRSCHIAHGNALDDASIVYKDIDCADFFFDLFYKCVYRVFVGDMLLALLIILLFPKRKSRKDMK